MAIFSNYGFGFSSSAASASSGLGGFDFSSVGTLELWLDARDTSSVTEESGAVSAWANQLTGKAVTSVTQSTGVLRPTLESGVLNGLDAIRFAGLTSTTSLTAAAAPVSGGPSWIYALI